MTAYKNLNGNSGIVDFEIGENHIDIQFKNGGIYRYHRSVIGDLNFLNLIAAAVIGEGLNSHINKRCRGLAERIRY